MAVYLSKMAATMVVPKRSGDLWLSISLICDDQP